MAEQIFISYRRVGGDVTAKLICESLKNRGYTVFYDYDSIHGGYFDSRILTAIEGCTDFVLILPEGGLDRCQNENDWVRQEIFHALKYNKNIIPVMMPGFTFPKDLPRDIAVISRVNGVEFVMAYYEAVISTIVDRLVTRKNAESVTIAQPDVTIQPTHQEESVGNAGLKFTLSFDGASYTVSRGTCTEPYIIIPETYQGKPVTTIGKGAFENCNFLIDITIPNSVTDIGNVAFANCKALTDITIPDSVTTIGDRVFSGCTALSEITLSNTVTQIGIEAFNYCTGLTAVTIPESVTVIGDLAFACCSYLTTVTMGNHVTHIGKGAFWGCEDLTEISLSPSVTHIGDEAFGECRALTEITIPDGITRIGEQTFFECQSLTDVTIPNRVTDIGSEAFRGCSSLANITIPSGVKSIGSHAFADCSSLTDIRYDGTAGQWKNIKTGLDCFKNVPCTSIPTCLKKSPKPIAPSVSQGLEYKLNTNGTGYSVSRGTCQDTTVVIPATYEGKPVIGIAPDAFREDSELKKITIPDSVTELGEWAFYHCTSLINIKLPNGVAVIGMRAFSDCSFLEKIEIPGSLTQIGDMAFWGCRSLKNIRYNGTSQQWKQIQIGDHCFHGVDPTISLPTCLKKSKVVEVQQGSKGLVFHLNEDGESYSVNRGTCMDAHIEIPDSYRGKPVTRIETPAFQKSFFLKSIAIPDSIIQIDDFAFADCTSLTTIKIPAGVTYIGQYTFSGCASLIKIDIPEGVTYIGNYAFTNCQSLSYVTIPNSVTDISHHAFSYCHSLTEITIPQSVKWIGSSAFWGCSSLTNIFYEGSAWRWKWVKIEKFCFSDTPAQFIECANGKKTKLPDSC